MATFEENKARREAKEAARREKINEFLYRGFAPSATEGNRKRRSRDNRIIPETYPVATQKSTGFLDTPTEPQYSLKDAPDVTTAPMPIEPVPRTGVLSDPNEAFYYDEKHGASSKSDNPLVRRRRDQMNVGREGDDYLSPMQTARGAHDELSAMGKFATSRSQEPASFAVATGELREGIAPTAAGDPNANRNRHNMNLLRMEGGYRGRDTAKLEARGDARMRLDEMSGRTATPRESLFAGYNAKRDEANRGSSNVVRPAIGEDGKPIPGWGFDASGKMVDMREKGDKSGEPELGAQAAEDAGIPAREVDAPAQWLRDNPDHQRYREVLDKYNASRRS